MGATSTSSARLCTSCGFLDLPLPERSTIALRSDPSGLPSCPSCGEGQWTDLGNDALRMAQRDIELREATARGSVASRGARRAWALAKVGGLVGILGSLVFLLTHAQRLTVLLVMAPALVAIVAVVVHAIGGARDEAVRTRLPDHPSRWRRALPAAVAPRGTTMRGIARATGGLLIAPVSGRPCLAYELGVRADEDGDAPRSTWLLLEQRSAALTVEDHEIGIDAVVLVADRRRVEVSPAGREALEARGFLPFERLYVFESIVEAGDAVIVESCEEKWRGRTGWSWQLRHAA